MPFLSLPTELLVLVSDNLPEPDLSSLAKTSRRLYDVFNPILWTSARDNDTVRAVRRLPRSGIIRAISQGNEEAVRKFISMGVNVNERHPMTGKKPLTIAASNGNATIFELLLDNGAVLDERNYGDAIALDALRGWNSRAILDVLVRYDIPLSALSTSEGFWHSHTPSTIRPLRKYFTSKFVAVCRDNPEDISNKEQLTRLLKYAILDDDLEAVQAIMPVISNERASDHSLNEYLGVPVASGNEAIVRALLHGGADPNALFPLNSGERLPMLYLALRYGHKEVATLLYEGGALLNFPEDNPESENAVPPVFGAVASHDPTLLDFVIGLGADITPAHSSLMMYHAIDRMGQVGYYHMFEDKPRSIDMLSRLVDLGADLNARSHSGYPIKYALHGGWVAGARFLIQNGADVDGPHDPSHRLETPLFLATGCNNFEIMELLLQHGADPNCTVYSDEGSLATPNTPLTVAGTGEAASLLLKYGASIKIRGSKKQTAFHRAVECPNIAVLLPLLSMDECIALVKSEGYEFLRSAIRAQFRFDSVKVVEALIRHGAAIDREDSRSGTGLLHEAIEHESRPELVELLLRHGADVHQVDSKGRTPLHLACALSFIEDAVKISRTLIEHGAEINQSDVKGYTPLHYACVARSVELASLFLEHGTNVSHRALDGETPLLLALKYLPSFAMLLIDHGAPINDVDASGRSPLYFAVRKGRSELVSALLSGGAATGGTVDTPLHLAAQYGNVDVVLDLLKHNAPINAQARKGDTPLMRAVQRGHADVVQALLDHGADLEITDRKGNTALDCAFGSGDELIEEILCNGGAY